jgi:hypothetical protein
VIADTIHRHDQLWGGDDVPMSCPSIMSSPSYFYLHNEILASVSPVGKQSRLYARHIAILFYLPSRSCTQEFPPPHTDEDFLVGFHDRMCSNICIGYLLRGEGIGYSLAINTTHTISLIGCVANGKQNGWYFISERK